MKFVEGVLLGMLMKLVCMTDDWIEFLAYIFVRCIYIGSFLHGVNICPPTVMVQSYYLSTTPSTFA